MFVASEDATSGSVMANAERISPARSGSSHCFFCSAEPYRTSTSMFPVSGALQLQTSGPIVERPIISHSGAYSRLVRPAPYSLSGKNRFQSPAARAFALSSSRTGGIDQRFASAACCSQHVRSPGSTTSRVNSRNRSWSAATSGRSSIDMIFAFALRLEGPSPGAPAPTHPAGGSLRSIAGASCANWACASRRDSGEPRSR